MVMRLGLFLILLFSSMPHASGQQLPPGKWWHRQEVVSRLALSPDQRERLDQVLDRSTPELIALRSQVEKNADTLRNQLDRPELDRDAVRKAAADVSAARARLFERELM
ncbi:MAG: periplasmic heavy metal sensor, partial [Thermoanaerobaculia bacterium]